MKRKFSKDSRLYQEYTNFMNDVISKNYARKVPADRPTPKKGKVWYLPHHAVYHPRKPDKVRVVFDCSARFDGVSLNDKLLQGPVLTSSLTSVLVRFRQEPYAFIGGIESMFYQVQVPEDQCDFVRFLWWPEGDVYKELEEYQMNVHIFGAVSSPSCSNFALRRAADDYEDKVGVETADILRRNFYVDDCLRSEKTEDMAVKRIRDIVHTCAHGGFHLTKFTSNSRRVLQNIPVQERAKELRSLDLNSDCLPIERALGVHWTVQSDSIGFRITIKDRPLTRRGILSTVGSIYDPLGMAAPALLPGKKILQDLCKEKIDWDDEIPEEYCHRWEQWKGSLQLLEKFAMNRCLKPTNFGNVVSRQVHSFSDASSTGYGQVSYLRQENDRGDVHCAFLIVWCHSSGANQTNHDSTSRINSRCFVSSYY